MRTILTLVVVGCLAWAPTASAQYPSSRTGALSATEARESAALTADEIPVSIDRIRRKLAEQPSERDGLRLDFYVEVYGRAPAIELFKNFDLERGPVPYGAPTHAEFLWVVTPQEFRSPPADLSTPLMALFKWLSGNKEK